MRANFSFVRNCRGLKGLNPDEFASLLMAEDRKVWQNAEEILQQLGITEGMTVADLACGPGYFTLPMARLVGGSGTVYAVDSSSTMLKHLKQNVTKGLPIDLRKTIVLMENDVTRTEIPENSVDVILMANIIHDLEDVRSFSMEVKRILKPQATAVDIDWHKRETESNGPPLQRRLSEDESRNLLTENGFRVKKAIYAGPYHYGLVLGLS